MNEDARDIERALLDTWRTVLNDASVMRILAVAELQWLGTSDLAQLTGYTEATIEKWRREGYIRMFLPADSREYRTTLQMWREDQDILIEAGIIGKSGKKPTVEERRRRIAERHRAL